MLKVQAGTAQLEEFVLKCDWGSADKVGLVGVGVLATVECWSPVDMSASVLYDWGVLLIALHAQESTHPISKVLEWGGERPDAPKNPSSLISIVSAAEAVAGCKH